jgi:hypothetical protein
VRHACILLVLLPFVSALSCNDLVYGPYCPVDGSPVTMSQFSICGVPRVIGQSGNALVWSTPMLQPTPYANMYRVVIPIYRVSLDGAQEKIHELDYVPESMASNGDYIAAIGTDGRSIVVTPRGQSQGWPVYEMSDIESIVSMDIVGHHLSVNFRDGRREYGIVVNLETREQVLSLYPAFYSIWSLAEDWLLTGYLFGDFTTAVELHSLNDDRVLQVVHAFTDSGAIDPFNNDVYWMDSPEYPSYGGLVRWDFSTGEITVEDPMFSTSQTTRLLVAVYDGRVVGKQESAGLARYFVRHRGNAGYETIVPFSDNYLVLPDPILVQDKLVWLDEARRKVAVYDIDLKTTTELDYPTN